MVAPTTRRPRGRRRAVCPLDVRAGIGFPDIRACASSRGHPHDAAATASDHPPAIGCSGSTCRMTRPALDNAAAASRIAASTSPWTPRTPALPHPRAAALVHLVHLRRAGWIEIARSVTLHRADSLSAGRARLRALAIRIARARRDGRLGRLRLRILVGPPACTLEGVRSRLRSVACRLLACRGDEEQRRERCRRADHEFVDTDRGATDDDRHGSDFPELCNQRVGQQVHLVFDVQSRRVEYRLDVGHRLEVGTDPAAGRLSDPRPSSQPRQASSQAAPSPRDPRRTPVSAKKRLVSRRGGRTHTGAGSLPSTGIAVSQGKGLVPTIRIERMTSRLQGGCSTS